MIFLTFCNKIPVIEIQGFQLMPSMLYTLSLLLQRLFSSPATRISSLWFSPWLVRCDQSAKYQYSNTLIKPKSNGLIISPSPKNKLALVNQRFVPILSNVPVLSSQAIFTRVSSGSIAVFEIRLFKDSNPTFFLCSSVAFLFAITFPTI